MATFISNSPTETELLGRQFAGEITPGSILALEGELGAGKTQFTKGIVAGLGSNAAVTSPTFTIVHEYAGGRLPIFHFDFFRLENRERLIQVGLDDYLFGDGVCIVEWADRFADLIPGQARWIHFEMESSECRKIEVR